MNRLKKPRVVGYTMSESASGEANSSSTAFGKDASVFPCRECGKKYDSNQGLRYHYKTDGNNCEGYECPKCGETYFVSEFGVSRHYGKSHDGSYSEYPHLADEQWFREKYVEEGHTTKDIADLLGCSRGIVGAWKNRHGIDSVTKYKSRGTGEDNPLWKDNKVSTNCDHCGQKMDIRPRRHERASHNFCSQECQNQWKRENWVGENNPLYKGGSLVYNSGWHTIRNDVRERDNYTCQACGASERNLDRELDVHHIKPAREFEDVTDAHESDNLVSLCRSCHQKWEGVPVKPKVIDNE